MNRRGGFPPIVTVLLFLVVIATAVIVGWWFVRVHSSATNRPLLSLSGGVYIAGNTVYLTLRNDGTAQFSGTVRIVTPYGSGEGTVTIDPGDAESLQIPITWDAGAPTANTFEVVIQAEGAGEIKAVAEMVRG